MQHIAHILCVASYVNPLLYNGLAYGTLLGVYFGGMAERD